MSEGPIKDKLSSDECYVIVSDEYRKVYLWKGVNSNVRSKFIGAKCIQGHNINLERKVDLISTVFYYIFFIFLFFKFMWPSYMSSICRILDKKKKNCDKVRAFSKRIYLSAV